MFSRFTDKISIALLTICASSLAAQPLPTSDIPQTQIVGGELAEEGAWPWMSALVYTSSQVSTSLQVANQNYASQSFTYGASGSGTGELADCQLGGNVCSNVTNKVCLIERGTYNFSDKVLNCQAGGGIAAIIFNNISGELSGTLGSDFAGTIPVVAISQADGESLKTQLGESATVSVSEPINSQQDSSCGASFLGGKWVVTAAHCVDSEVASFARVNVGEYDLSNGAEEALPIANIFIHPQYNVATLDHDIALIELTESVANTAITVASSETTDSFAQSNFMATALGWGGRIGYEPDDGPTGNFPDKLHQVELQLLTNAQCKTTLKNSFNAISDGITYSEASFGIASTNICASTPGGGKGTCQGDSGGPLIINGNEGWQLAGIVSSGFGCAAEGFPGIYTRVSEYTTWINSITNGVAIEPNVDFGYMPNNASITQPVKVTNNSLNSATLTYSVQGDNAFTIDDSNCLSLAAGASCEVLVTYNTNNVGEDNATLKINSTDSSLALSEALLEGFTLSENTSIGQQLSRTESYLKWFSGGNAQWQLNNSDASIENGNISYNQESTVMLFTTRGGTLNFQWSIFSEETEGREDGTYATLALYVDNQLVRSITENVEFIDVELELTAGSHRVAWVYQKDVRDTQAGDKAMLKNVTFAALPEQPTEPTTPSVENPVVNNTNNESSGGGALYGLIMLMLGIRTWRLIKAI